MARHPKLLSCMISGACDGEIRLWNVSTRSTTWRVHAHDGFVRGLSVMNAGDKFISVGNDSKLCFWNIGQHQVFSEREAEYDDRMAQKIEPLSVVVGARPFTNVDCSRASTGFVTSSMHVVEVWDPSHAKPTNTFEWGNDTVGCVRWNPSEEFIIASTGSDRSVCLYDIRAKTPIRKVIMTMKSNSLCWNPQRPTHFTVANEDSNCYTFDTRHMDKPVLAHKGHVSAVLDVDYSPNGQEFASGSYDRTVRIWSVNNPDRDYDKTCKSREVYHTKRMQRIFCVKFSADARFVLTASDDTNIRIWKAEASAPIGTISRRKKDALNYANALKKKYAHMKEIKTILNHRHVPKAIHKAARTRKATERRQNEKLQDLRKHRRAGSVKKKDAREKAVVTELS